MTELNDLDRRLGALRKALYVYQMNRWKKRTKPETINRLAQAVKQACADVAFPVDRDSYKPAEPTDPTPLQEELAAGYRKSLEEATARSKARHPSRRFKVLEGGGAGGEAPRPDDGG